MLTALDEELAALKRKEISKKTYLQPKYVGDAPKIAKGVRGGKVLLVGGGAEKPVIEKAAAKLVTVDYVKTGYNDEWGDVEVRLPFEDGMFDHAVIMNMFEILYDPRKACAEVYRVLRKGGKFWVSEPYGVKGQGYGILMTHSNVEKELEQRGLIHYSGYPEGMEKYSVSPEFLMNTMALGGFARKNMKSIKTGDLRGIVIGTKR